MFLRPSKDVVVSIIQDLIEERAEMLAANSPNRPRGDCREQAVKEFKELLRRQFADSTNAPTGRRGKDARIVLFSNLQIGSTCTIPDDVPGYPFSSRRVKKSALDEAEVMANGAIIKISPSLYVIDE